MGRVPHSSALAAKPAVQVGEDKKDADLMRRRQLKRGGFDEDSAGALQYAMQAPQSLCMDAGQWMLPRHVSRTGGVLPLR